MIDQLPDSCNFVAITHKKRSNKNECSDSKLNPAKKHKKCKDYITAVTMLVLEMEDQIQ